MFYVVLIVEWLALSYCSDQNLDLMVIFGCSANVILYLAHKEENA